MHLFKKYKCETCGEKFRQEEYLMQHHQLYHSGKEYDCKRCNMNFSSMEEMRTHMQRSHTYRGKRDS